MQSMHELADNKCIGHMEQGTAVSLTMCWHRGGRLLLGPRRGAITKGTAGFEQFDRAAPRLPKEIGMFETEQFVADCRTAFAADATHKAILEVLARAMSETAAVLRALGE